MNHDLKVPCTFYIRPSGKTASAAINRITEEDAQFFLEHDIRIGMEDLGDDRGIAVYAELTQLPPDEDGNFPEIAYINREGFSADCAKVMANVREQCEILLRASDAAQAE